VIHSRTEKYTAVQRDRQQDREIQRWTEGYIAGKIRTQQGREICTKHSAKERDTVGQRHTQQERDIHSRTETYAAGQRDT
jgi:hypothetical protein